MSDRTADVARLRSLLASQPNDRVGWHNLAAAEGDLGRVEAAEAAARRAIALGIAAPETRLVLARALQSQRRLDEAERMFAEAIALRPDYVDAHRDLAQLLWMRTGSARAALGRVEKAIRKAPAAPGLYLVHSLVLETAGDPDGSLAAAMRGLAHAPDDVELLRQASHLALAADDATRALSLARQAAARAPQDPGVRISLCEAFMALGQLEEANRLVATLTAERPLNQYILALQATVWRLLGDPRHAALHDYRSLVQTRLLAAPPGFRSIEDFMAALSTQLEALHTFRAHPFKQSVRGGSQLPLQAAEMAHPLIAALFGSIHAAVGEYLAAVGSGPDPFRSRNSGRFGMTGAWSVRLASGGYHTDHVHPQGWLSSACYIATPECCAPGPNEAADHAGWLRLGAPGVPTMPPLSAEMFVRPRPGLLVLFPAYLWHGVVPFVSATPRLSVAFDAVPLPPG
jgi:tetratricopeptide (TPR) repeat protein